MSVVALLEVPSTEPVDALGAPGVLPVLPALCEM